MFLRIMPLFFVICVSEINGAPLDYTFSIKAEGWLKFYDDKASWSEAFAQCDIDGGVIASPLTSQLRDAIEEFLVREGLIGLWILTGVQSDFTKGDFYSIEGYPLSKMPVITNTFATIEKNMPESCVVWKPGKEEVLLTDCEVKREYVCYKKMKSAKSVIGCGTHKTDYSYDSRSGSCYKFHREAQPWSRAYEICRKEGAYLAVINNEVEQVVLTELFAKYPRTEIIIIPYEGSAPENMASMGIRNWPKDGKSWLTIKRETLAEAGFEEWRSENENEPNPAPSARCVTLHREGKYVNVLCEAVFPFICEKDPVFLKKDSNCLSNFFDFVEAF